MNGLIPLYVTLSTFMDDRVERLKNREDRGAQGIEYAALIVLAAAIIGILWGSGVLGKLTTGVTEAVGKLFPGAGGSGSGN